MKAMRGPIALRTQFVRYDEKRGLNFVKLGCDASLRPFRDLPLYHLIVKSYAINRVPKPSRPKS